MVRHHRSFLVRWWKDDQGGSRIELLHIQSGTKTVVDSLTDALGWMSRDEEESAASADDDMTDSNESDKTA